jgi:hypothetical protein
VYQFLFAKFGRRILTEGLRLEYLSDPELWLAIGLFATFVIVGRWLSKSVFSKPTAVAKAPTEGPSTGTDDGHGEGRRPVLQRGE